MSGFGSGERTTSAMPALPPRARVPQLAKLSLPADDSDDEFCMATAALDFNSPATRGHDAPPGSTSSYGGRRRRATPGNSPEFPSALCPGSFGQMLPPGVQQHSSRVSSMSRPPTQMSGLSELAIGSNASTGTLPFHHEDGGDHHHHTDPMLSEDDLDVEDGEEHRECPVLLFSQWRPLSSVEYMQKAITSTPAFNVTPLPTPLIPPSENSAFFDQTTIMMPTMLLPVCPQVGYYAHQGQRRSMEDAAAFEILSHPCAPVPTHFAGIYDGHNGSTTADLAAKHVHEVMQQSPHFATNVGASLVDALRAVDIAMLEQSAAQSSGSTACIACVRGNELTVANLGDCRAVLATSDGRSLPLSRDHKPSCEHERTRIEKSGGAAAFGRIDGLSVSRGVGDFNFKSQANVYGGGGELSNVADILTLPITDDCTCVIIASDGLWDKVSNQEAVNVALRHIAPRDSGNHATAHASTPRDVTKSAARDLVDLAVHRGTSDNVSAIVIKLHTS
jgi:protein phosphatase 2C family protein 2/3